MVQYGVFIAHAHEDKVLARKVKDTLDRILELSPYLAEDYQLAGENFKERIMNDIYQSQCFIVFLTENGIESQWVNQELGYACRVKKQKRNYRIIPISKSNLTPKGFITTDTEDFIFLDKYDFETFMANIFIQVRFSIYNALRQGGLHVVHYCPSCKDPVGLPLKVTCQLPSHEDYIRTLDSGNTGWRYPCHKCKREISFKLTTFEQVEAQGSYRDPFTEQPFRLDPSRPR